MFKRCLIFKFAANVGLKNGAFTTIKRTAYLRGNIKKKFTGHGNKAKNELMSKLCVNLVYDCEHYGALQIMSATLFKSYDFSFKRTLFV